MQDLLDCCSCLCSLRRDAESSSFPCNLCCEALVGRVPGAHAGLLALCPCSVKAVRLSLLLKSWQELQLALDGSLQKLREDMQALCHTSEEHASGGRLMAGG